MGFFNKISQIPIDAKPESLHWRDGQLVDWVDGGTIYDLGGKVTPSYTSYGYPFDAATQSADGVFVFVYERLGTQGILLKNGQIIRELHRSHYHAKRTHYPIAFFKLPSGEDAIIHCPNEYCMLEVELVESGKKITAAEGRDPVDMFYAFLEVNEANTHLISNGWVWHPFEVVDIYDINKGLQDNAHFDQSMMFNTQVDTYEIEGEVIFAEFLTNDLVLMATIAGGGEYGEEELADLKTLYGGEIALFSISRQQFVKKIAPDNFSGWLVPINKTYVLDCNEEACLYNLDTGEVTSLKETITADGPVVMDRKNKRLAVTSPKSIDIYSFG